MLDEKEAEITQARETYENEMKTTIKHSRNAIELTKKQAIETEIMKVKDAYEKEMKEKEEAHFQLLVTYDEKCNAWQSEKQVTLTPLFADSSFYRNIYVMYRYISKNVIDHCKSLGNTFRNRATQGRITEISIYYLSKCRDCGK